MHRIGVMQVTDTLAIGGLERVAVNLANELPGEQYRSYFCATREEGQLRSLIQPHVKYFFPKRRGRFGLAAVHRLAAYIQENKIHIVHAHGTSLFISAAAAVLNPGVRLVWHDHFGKADSQERSAFVYGTAVKAADGIVAVTENLAAWSRQKLGVRSDRVWYIPNFITRPVETTTVPELPGRRGCRLVCVANLRPQKDHSNLLRAMKSVKEQFPQVHLLLLGNADDKAHFQKITETISQENLSAHVSWLGPRLDVSAILRECDVGVLSSASEGLPLALIEYGMAGLATVTTKVGQCADVLDQGRAGLLVPPFLPTALAEAVLQLLRCPQQREVLGKTFSEHVRKTYSSEAVMGKIQTVYKTVLG